MTAGASAATPEVSIIIRTYNEQKYLPLLLDALDQQAFRQFETILVDSGSVDDTCAIAGDRVDKLVRIEQHDFTFGYALNIGGQAADGRFLVMVSAHTRPCHPQWLEQLVAPLRDDRVAMSYGRQIGWSTSKFGEAADFYRVFHTRREKLVPPHFFANNANSAVRRDLWEQHPFDEKLPGLEDAEFARHWMDQGYDVIYEPDAVLNHIHEETWPQVHRRYFREAVAARVMGMHDAGHVPGVWLRETWWLAKDLWRLAFDEPAELGHKAKSLWFKEILKFRWLKATGTAEGLRSDETIDDQESRETYYFDRASVAVRITGPGKADIVDLPVHAPKPGEVVLRVAYIAVDPQDHHYFDMLPAEAPSLAPLLANDSNSPVIPGQHFSATVVAAGTNVRHIKPGMTAIVETWQSCGRCPACKQGDMQACDRLEKLGSCADKGAYADYITVPGRFVHAVPQDMDMKNAALVPLLARMCKFLRRMETLSGGAKNAGPVYVIGTGARKRILESVLSTSGYEILAGGDTSKKAAFVCLLDATEAGIAQALRCASHQAIMVAADDVLARQTSFIQQWLVTERTIAGLGNVDDKDYGEALKTAGKIGLTGSDDQILPLDLYEQAWQQSGKIKGTVFLQVAER